MIKLVFHKEDLNTIGTVYDKHILSFTTNSSRPVFCRKLTWQNLKGLVELANFARNLKIKVAGYFYIINIIRNIICFTSTKQRVLFSWSKTQLLQPQLLYNIDLIISLVKLHYFQLTFLKNCVYKNKRNQ